MLLNKNGCSSRYTLCFCNLPVSLASLKYTPDGLMEILFFFHSASMFRTEFPDYLLYFVAVAWMCVCSHVYHVFFPARGILKYLN